MKRNKHTGNRSLRNKTIMSHRLGNYLIVTDTKETEKNYFEGLRESLSEHAKKNIVIKVLNTKTEDLIQKAKEFSSKEPQYNQIWIVFDRDQVVKFDSIIEEAKKSEMKVAWSNPCFEIWLSAYFGLMPNIVSSIECCESFKKTFKKYTGKEYAKNLKSLYDILLKNGDEIRAIELASNKLKQAQEKTNLPSKQFPATIVHKLVKEIKEKANTFC